MIILFLINCFLIFFSIFAIPKQGNIIDSVAQLVEHYTFNVVVLGSNPSGITKASEKSEAFCVKNISSFSNIP